MKFCRNCGAQLGDDVKFCASCGQPVEVVNAAADNGEQDASQNNQQPNQYQNQYQYQQPNQYQQPYQAPYGYQPQPMNGFAIAALVLGIVSSFLNGLLFIPSILAIVFGAVGLRQCDTRNQRGRGMAIAGLVLGIIFLVIYIIITVIAINTASTAINYAYSFGNMFS